MSDVFSVDEQILIDRKSSFVVRVAGKKKRLHLCPGDFLVIDRSLPYKKDQLALIVRQGKFCLDYVSEELLTFHDPENGDFIWGMVRAMVREIA